MTVKVIFPDSPDNRKADLLVDIVAVHGLGEDGVSAWTHPENGCFWLRDLLPQEENIKARILALDYKADATSFFGSSSADRILHHAQTLVEELNAEREHDGSSQRPIIFICHGLGGLIVKKALSYSSLSTSAKVAHLHAIFSSTFGLVFLGTPHEGIEKAKWSLLAKGLKGILKDRNNLAAAIEKNSETLQNITEQFAPLLRQFHIHNFWETIQTSRAIGRGYIVSSSSAAPAWDDTTCSGLPGTHSQMCKFRDRNDSAYRSLCGILQRFHNLAEPVISSRSRETKRFLAARRQYEATEILAFDIHKGNKPFNLQWGTTTDPRNKHFKVEIEVSNNYTGREKLAQGLQKRIFAPHSQQKRFVLYGMGGSGKTQFCSKFAWDNRESFWGVFWVDASSHKTAEQCFSDVARIGQMEEKFECGLYWLSRQEMPWLLVIDGANDTKFDYAQYFPSGGMGHILVTSRNPECKVHATIGSEEFASLEENDAISLLLRSASVGDLSDEQLRGSARPIAKALGYLPLALIQAGAAIQQNICSLEEYLDIFNLYKRKTFSTELQQGKSSYRLDIFTTFEVSFDKIRSFRTEEAKDALEILHVMAFLHFDQVPEALFERAWDSLSHGSELFDTLTDKVARVPGDLATVSSAYGGWLTFLAEGRLPQIFSQPGSKWDKLRFRKAIHVLRSYSLIFRNVGANNYSMHPMVQFWARERLRPKAQKLWGNMASRLLAESITTNTKESKESDVVYRRLLMPHIDSCLKVDYCESRQGLDFDDASLSQYAKFAAVYAECGRWIEAATIQEKILQNRRSTLDKDSLEAVDIMTDLARSYWNSSQGQKALKLQTALLELFNLKLGPDDPRTLQAMDSLGRTHWLCGSTSQADKLGRQSYEGLTKVVGADHPFTLSAMHNYGRARLHLSDSKMAQELLMEAWEGRSRLLGETHLDTLETMQDLGMSCLALKQIDEADHLVSFVLDARKRILGQEHAHTLWSINDLSKIYCAQGYASDAVSLLIPTREIASRTLGTTHIGTIMTIFNLSQAYTQLHKFDQAETILSELLETEEKYIGPGHPDVFSAKLALAKVCKQRGNMRRAETLFREAFEGRSAVFGPNNPRTLQAKMQLLEIS